MYLPTPTPPRFTSSTPTTTTTSSTSANHSNTTNTNLSTSTSTSTPSYYPPPPYSPSQPTSQMYDRKNTNPPLSTQPPPPLLQPQLQPLQPPLPFPPPPSSVSTSTSSSLPFIPGTTATTTSTTHTHPVPASGLLDPFVPSSSSNPSSTLTPPPSSLRPPSFIPSTATSSSFSSSSSSSSSSFSSSSISAIPPTHVPSATPTLTQVPHPNSVPLPSHLPQPNIPMPLYPKATYGSTASLSMSTDSLANSFSYLGIQTPILAPPQPPPSHLGPALSSSGSTSTPSSTMVSLIGAPPTPHQVHDPPPSIRLSSQASCTPSPYSNCSSTFQRCTINVIPQSPALLSKSKMPLALYIAPFRDPEPNEPPIPVIQTPTIVRCRRCRTYINPYVQFLDKGQRWKCNLCYFPNDVPESFDYDPFTQQYMDRWQRPELNHAVVEFVAPSEYMLRPPQPPAYLFLIDISFPAVLSGLVQVFCEAMKLYLNDIPNIDGRTLIGFITMDGHALQFYSLEPSLNYASTSSHDEGSATKPSSSSSSSSSSTNETLGSENLRMFVMSDLEDVFLPAPEGLFVNLAECKASIFQFLDSLPSLLPFSPPKDDSTSPTSTSPFWASSAFHSSSSFASASAQGHLKPGLQAAYQLMQSMGGKIAAFLASSFSTSNASSSSTSSMASSTSSSSSSSSSIPTSLPFYKQFAVDCSRCQISVDLFLFYVLSSPTSLTPTMTTTAASSSSSSSTTAPSVFKSTPQLTSAGFPDFASMSCVSKFTAGNVYTYDQFHALIPAQREKFHHEFHHYLKRPLGLEAVMRVRASRGLRMSVYHGHFFVRSTDLLALPNVHPDNTYCIELAIEETLASNVVCFQTALLHTTAFGERRIRVLTLALPVSPHLSDLLTSIDPGALLLCLTRKALERSLEATPLDAREAVINKCVDLLAHQPGLQLTCPWNVKLVPLLCLGLIKHPAFLSTWTSSQDQRRAMNLLETCCIETLLTNFHPFVYPLHMEPGGVLPATSEGFERHGVYLVYNGQEIGLWVSRQVSPALVMDLFQVETYLEVPEGPCQLPSVDTHVSKKTRDLIDHIRQRALALTTSWPLVSIAKEDSPLPLRTKVLSMLIEDRMDHGPSYPQFLANLREKVAGRSGGH